MSSFQPIAIGRPVSQDPYPSVPYTQNFPNEPETTESSLLQAPLNNQSQNYYPPHHLYGQGQLHNPYQGSNQQPEFMVVPIDPQSRELNAKIADIDKRLKSGWYACYLVWIYLSIIGGFIKIFESVFLLWISASLDRSFKGSRAFTVTLATLISIGSCVWMLHICFVFKNAMKNKNLEAAKRGFKSLLGSLAFSFVFLICVLIAIKFDIEILPMPKAIEREYMTPASGQASLYIFAISASIWLFGAEKVIELLKQRETLASELNNRFGANLVCSTHCKELEGRRINCDERMN